MSPPIRRAGSRAWQVLAAIAVVFFGLRLTLQAVSGWNTADEAWILQIVERIRAGETLYRDIFFNCTPLAIYLARATCALTGPSVLALKALCAAMETGIFLATLAFLKSLRPQVNWHPMYVCLLALVMLPIPVGHMAHLYNSLATFLVLVAAIAVLKFRELPGTPRAVLIGAILGLALAAKQNMGAYLAIASAAVMLHPAGGSMTRRAGHVLTAAATAGLMAAVLLLPTIFAGAGRELIIDTLLMKGQYLEAGRISFLDGLRELGRVAPGREDFDPVNFTAHLVYPLAMLGLLAMIAELMSSATRRAMLTATPFLLVLAAGLYPRADAWHLANAYPAIVIILAIGAASLPRRIRRPLAGVTGALAAVIAMAILAEVPRRLTSEHYVFSRLPHLWGIRLAEDEEERLSRLASELKALPQPTFILSADASSLYLVSGTRNPTPYDYPISSELPPGAQETIVREIRSARIERIVTLPRQGWYSPLFVPETLQSFAERECVVEGTIPPLEIRRLSPNR